MELFKDCESYREETIVPDSRRYVRKNNPILPNESEEEYTERLFWLTNDEIERRILICGKKRPDYSNQNVKLKESVVKKIIHKNIKNLLIY